MKTASQELVNEHNAILQALNVLETICVKITSEGSYDKKDLEDILDFLKIFADKCHHGKEEGLLFPALEEAGMKKEFGPIAVMLSEHVMGRGFIKQMDEALNSNPLNTAGFVDASENYIYLLRAHIQKENQILHLKQRKKFPKLVKQCGIMDRKFTTRCVKNNLSDKILILNIMGQIGG